MYYGQLENRELLRTTVIAMLAFGAVSKLLNIKSPPWGIFRHDIC